MAQEKRFEARKRVFEMLFEREFRTDETPEEIFDIAMEDAPGGARAVLKVLADAERNIEYMYAFVGKESGKALTVLCTDDNEAAEKVLEASGFNKVNPKDVYRV